MSIVGRGLGRRGVAAALVVTAGLGLGLLVEEDALAGGAGQVYGSGRLADDAALAQHVRDSWDLLDARLAAQRALAATPPAVPADPPAPAPALTPAEPAPVAGEAAPAAAAAAAAAPQALQPDPAMLATVRAAEEAALLALLLQVDATTYAVAPAPDDDELALVAALLAAAQ